MVAVVMHCNLSPPDITPVILGFTYEAHNALANQHIKFKQIGQ